MVKYFSIKIVMPLNKIIYYFLILTIFVLYFLNYIFLLIWNEHGGYKLNYFLGLQVK